MSNFYASNTETGSGEGGNLSSIADDVNALLVTANVGSLFEDWESLLHIWLKAFLSKVTQLQPEFLALHLQELGGKTYEKSLICVQKFVRRLCDAPEMLDYQCMRLYLDEDFKNVENFTALGNLYFVRRNIQLARIWNFQTHSWEDAEGKDIHTGNIETVPTKEKAKFPRHFFPECKWSRKGFLRTRWELNGTVFDLVNIHLFHDASNLAAYEESPSIYCRIRLRALAYTLERFLRDKRNGVVPLFVFGDFNFRCDTASVVKVLTENLTKHRSQDLKGDHVKVQFRNAMGDNVLTLGKKIFNHINHQTKFKHSWLRDFDRELEPLKKFLEEFPITFPPTYPYEENVQKPTTYMTTRCPAWCDRVLLSPEARSILDTHIPPIYGVIGESVCMGDHKPIFLSVRLKAQQGIYKSCENWISVPKGRSLNGVFMASSSPGQILETATEGDGNCSQQFLPPMTQSGLKTSTTNRRVNNHGNVYRTFRTSSR